MEKFQLASTFHRVVKGSRKGTSISSKPLTIVHGFWLESDIVHGFWLESESFDFGQKCSHAKVHLKGSGISQNFSFVAPPLKSEVNSGKKNKPS